jgi:metal transporter CNNM
VEYIITIILLAGSAMFSGLTLGYFSLGVHALERRARLGDEKAAVIYSVRKHGNQLLTTLLLGNVAVNTALSVYLGSLVSGLVAGTIATILIFMFGEIIPQAAFSRHAEWVGYRFAPIMRVLIVAMSPITFPIAYVLDRLLGEEMPTKYSKREIMEIVSELEDIGDGQIDADEERIVHGALQFSHTKVREVMTTKDQVIIFDEHQRFNDEFIDELAKHSYSRYPVSSGNTDNIVGILYTKDLLLEDDDIKLKEAKDAYDPKFLAVKPDDNLDKVLALMLKSYQHMAIVRTRNESFLGVITLEDIIEEIIQREIEDEDDIES